MQLIDPRFSLPETVVIGMRNDVVPERNRPVQEAGVDVRQGTESQIPRVGVVSVEVEMSVRVLVRLLQNRVLDGVALAQGAVTMHVVVHPLIDR